MSLLFKVVLLLVFVWCAMIFYRVWKTPEKRKFWPVTFLPIWGAIGLITFPISLLSVMAFDAPGSENNPLTWIAFLAIFSAPLVIVVSIIGSIRAYKNNQYKRFLIFVLSPLANLIFLILSILAK